MKLSLFVLLLAAAEALEHAKLKSVLSDTIPGRYIVGLKQDTLFSQAFNNQNDIHIHHQYDHPFLNALSLSIDQDKIEHTLQNILNRPDVAYVSPVRRIPRPEIFIDSRNLSASSVLPHHMTQVDRVHNSGSKGRGILVAVLDTGIDYLHPALGGGFGEGFKVSAGYDLVGDDYTGENSPVPDNDPLDSCGADSGASGHGTHVSGIIAGSYSNFTGVAPEANLAMYRVFGCSGATGDDVIVKALLMAFDAGVDVINLSLGSTNPWADVASDPEIDVVNRIVASGVHVVISAGNAGSSGAYTLSSPSSARGAFSVASVENEYYTTTTLLASGIPIHYSISGGVSESPVGGKLTLSSKDMVNDACHLASITEDVKGKVVLIERGTCSFTEKVNNAAAAGAVSVIFYDNMDEPLSGASTPGGMIGSVMITQKDGQALISALANETVTIDFEAGANVVVPVSNGGSISTFSSLGPSAEIVFKPNIAGVGGHVYSTVPRYLGSWGVMSGTSMSSPYVAGSVALYLNALGKDQPVRYVQEQFQNYAKPCLVDKTNTTDNPIRAGAGLVQVYDTIHQQVHISPAEISFNDTASDKYRIHNFVVTNNGEVPVKYRLVNQISTGVSPYNRKKSGYTPLEPAVNVMADAKLRFSENTLALGPGESRSVTVKVTVPKTNKKDHIYYGGYIALQSDQNQELRVPYIGIKGKQKKLPIFDDGFPYISNGTTTFATNETFVYSRRNMAGPYTVYRLLNPTRTLKAELVHAESNKVLGLYSTGHNYLSRNFMGMGYYSAFYWDGTFVPFGFKGVPAIPAPNGTYRLRVSVLKIMGNPNHWADWEVFNSGLVVLTD